MSRLRAIVQCFVLTLAVAGAALFCLNATVAQAQVTAGPGQQNPANTQQSTAAAGTMIAAAMETVGYHEQANVLAELSKLLETGGALIFLGVAISAILTAALLGSYRPALWMFVGPPLFFFVSGITVNGYQNREDANGAEWRFGSFSDTEKIRDRFIEVGGQQASVSMVFHRYNVLISEAAQIVIDALTQSDVSKQMIFMARQRTMEDLFGERFQDASVMALTSYFMVECATEIGDARLIAIGGVDPNFKQNSSYFGAVARYCERFSLPDKQLSQGAWMDFVYSLPDEARGFSIPRDQHLNKHQAAPQKVSCEQMWRWVMLGAYQESMRAFDDAATRNFDWYAWTIYGTQLWQRVINAISDKTTNGDGVAQSRKEGKDPCPPGNAGNDFFNNGDTFNRVAGMISGMMLRKAMTSTPGQQIFNGVIHGHHGVKPLEGAGKVLSTSPNSRRSILERQRAEQFAEARRYEAYTLIQLFPYLQGFLLYMLALLYPFFALLVLLPGQAGQFLSWLALWAWVKSWDVGWALIMVADEIAWELLPKHSYFNPDRESAFNSPINLLEGAYGGDPSYSISTYWLLLSTMVLGVPLITAHAILGTKKAIASRLLQGAEGLQGIAENYGNSAMINLAGRQVGRYTQQSAQARINATLQRGFAKVEEQQAQNQAVDDTVTHGGHGLAGQTVAASPKNAKDFISGFFNSLSGGGGSSSPPPAIGGNGSSPSGGSQPSGASSQGASAVSGAMFGNSTVPTSADRTRAEQSRAALNIYGAARVAPAMAKLDPTGIIQNAMNGGNGAVVQMGAESDYVMDQVLRAAGFDESIPGYNVAHDEFQQAFRLQLHRRAMGGLTQTDADFMAMSMAVTLPAFHAVGGPAGAGYDAWRRQAGYVGRQREIGYSQVRTQNQHTARIQSVMIDQLAREAYYDPRFALASEAEAYLSENRGGEFFAIGQYDPDFAFRLQRASMQSDVDWNFEVGRAQGNRDRWAFQIFYDYFKTNSDAK